ncbi:hypothetical protein [Cetobacterium sp.]|uniref:hypothetical protein n=1 Tax=Cetobacterium sp. TaxID=2071632 RepID=UPI003F386717
MKVKIDRIKFIEALNEGEAFKTVEENISYDSKGKVTDSKIYDIENSTFIKNNLEKLKKLGLIEEKKIIVE